jgi:general secretion pathway protein A
MYIEHFGLKELPFSIAPDPRYLYMSSQHQEALAHLIYGINSEGGFIVLTGEVGTGKTTVCRCLLEQVPENTDTAFILNPKLTVEELLATFCDELGISYPEGNTSIKVFIDRINDYLLDAFARGRKTVLIIEEAQNLGMDLLEQIRLLTNLETNQRKLLQIIMLGQPELNNILSHPELRQLDQRITARYHLGPISKEEIASYVNHRLLVAGGRSNLFTASAIDKLFQLSGGIPRIINLLCDRALLGAYVQGQDHVDKSTLIKAAREVFGKSRFQWQDRKLVFAGFVFTILAAVLILILYNYKSQPMAVKKSELTTLKTSQWPVTQPAHLSEEKAFQSLLKIWNIVYVSNSNDACRQAQAHGLNCFNAQGSLDSLIKLNRPAVLRLGDDQNSEFYVTLIKLKDHLATIAIGDEMRTVDIKEIALKWLGNYTLLLRKPQNYKNYIKPGDRGTQVEWLKNSLALIQGRAVQPKENDLYDEMLLKQVKSFQQEEGLIPDGIVGPMTLIHLNSRVPSDDPVLTEKEQIK